jgi:hypothetical protein
MEAASCAPIARDVRQTFVSPELGIGCRSDPSVPTRVHVPVATVDEDNLPPAPEDEIGSSRQISAVQAVSVAEGMYQPTDAQLRRGVLRPDALHV